MPTHNQCKRCIQDECEIRGKYDGVECHDTITKISSLREKCKTFWNENAGIIYWDILLIYSTIISTILLSRGLVRLSYSIIIGVTALMTAYLFYDLEIKSLRRVTLSKISKKLRSEGYHTEISEGMLYVTIKGRIIHVPMMTMEMAHKKPMLKIRFVDRFSYDENIDFQLLCCGASWVNYDHLQTTMVVEEDGCLNCRYESAILSIDDFIPEMNHAVSSIREAIIKFNDFMIKYDEDVKSAKKGDERVGFHPAETIPNTQEHESSATSASHEAESNDENQDQNGRRIGFRMQGSSK